MQRRCISLTIWTTFLCQFVNKIWIHLMMFLVKFSWELIETLKGSLTHPFYFLKLKTNLWEFLDIFQPITFFWKKFNELDLKNCEQFRFSINSLQLRNHLIVLIFLWKHFLEKINSTPHLLTHISLLYLFLSAILFSSYSSKNSTISFYYYAMKLKTVSQENKSEERKTIHSLPKKKEILKLKACDKMSG